MDIIDTAFDQWLSELLDMSKRNRLLYFRPGRGYLRITHPSVDHVFDGLTNRGRRYTFYRTDQEDEGPDSTVNEQLDLFLAADPTANGPDTPAASPDPLLKPVRPPRADEIVASGDAKTIEATLYRLRLRSRSALLEQGINVLFVAFGTLEWTEASSSSDRVKSPLLLVPVRLERDTALDPYTLAPLDEGLIFNPTLARKLELDFKLSLGLPNDSDTT